MNPLISIIIPTYNQSDFLSKAIKSVLDQSYINWEVIVIDNNSTDQTRELMINFTDTRIKYISVANNGCISKSRNLGVENASGEWLAFLDSDDEWYYNKLEIFIKTLAVDKDLDVFCNSENKILNNKIIGVVRCGPMTRNFYKTLLIYGNRLSTSAVIVRRGFVNKYDVRFREETFFIAVEDYGYWLDLARLNARFKFVPFILSKYRLHNNNTSARSVSYDSNLKALLKHHVYNVQEFTVFTNKLWSMISLRLEIQESFYYVKRLHFFRGASKMLFLFICSPLVTTKILSNFLSRSIFFNYHFRWKL